MPPLPIENRMSCDAAKRLLVVEFPDIFQFMPGLLGLAIDGTRFKPAETKRLPRGFVKPFISARRLDLALNYTSIHIDQKIQDNDADLFESSRRRRIFRLATEA